MGLSLCCHIVAGISTITSQHTHVCVYCACMPVPGSHVFPFLLLFFNSSPKKTPTANLFDLHSYLWCSCPVCMNFNCKYLRKLEFYGLTLCRIVRKAHEKTKRDDEIKIVAESVIRYSNYKLHLASESKWAPTYSHYSLPIFSFSSSS